MTIQILVPQGFGKVDGKQALEEMMKEPASVPVSTPKPIQPAQPVQTDTRLNPSKFHPAVKAAYYVGAALLCALELGVCWTLGEKWNKSQEIQNYGHYSPLSDYFRNKPNILRQAKEAFNASGEFYAPNQR